MFIPHCHNLMDSFFGNGHELQDSMRLASAIIIERELQESRREREKSGDNDNPENSKVIPFSYRV